MMSRIIELLADQVVAHRLSCDTFFEHLIECRGAEECRHEAGLDSCEVF